MDTNYNELTELIVEEPEDVLLETNPVDLPTFTVDDKVVLKPDAVYSNGTSVPASMINVPVYVRRVHKNNLYGISTNATGRINGMVHAQYLTKYEFIVNSYNAFIPSGVAIKAKANETSSTLKTLVNGGIFTIVNEKNDWAHLKNGGWVPVESIQKL